MEVGSGYKENDVAEEERQVGYGSESDSDADPVPTSSPTEATEPSDSYFSNIDGSLRKKGIAKANGYDEVETVDGIQYHPVNFDDDSDGEDVVYSMYIPESTKRERLLASRDPDSSPSPSISVQHASAGASSELAPERSSSGLPIDWNEEFQRLLEMQEATVAHRLDKNLRISALSKNFVDLARRWGKVIIEEHFLHPQYRTISPIEIGGQAGGVKYIYNGILFKLQTDWKGIYGSHFLAMKTGGLELKGLMRYYGCEGLHVPMMAVIDYRGFRLVAMSILPLEKKKTLIYGSADAGKTVHAADGYFNKMMAQAATKINIKGHLCGKEKDSMKFIHGPTDIEGHLGSDKRYYVLDFARMYPPTAESDVRKAFLYKVFRPEFVSRYRVPLSSDAFSPFSHNDPSKKENDAEVLEATQQLLNSTIPAFALWLDENYRSANLEERLDSLTEMVHREGINARYLGKIRCHVKSPYLKRFILMEMTARVIKHKVRQSLRETMQSQRTLAGDAFTNVILENFNQMLGCHDKSPQFWAVIQKKLEYFKDGLSVEEKKPSFDIKGALEFKALFHRLSDMLGVKLSYDSTKEFEANPNEFKLVVADITDVHVKVKKMNTISLAEGNALAIQAIQELANQGSRHHDRLFRLAMAKFDSAILATPDNTEMLRHYAAILTEMALLKANAGESALDYLEKAFDKYTVARDSTGLLELGEKVVSAKLLWSEKDKALQLADKCYLEVLKADGINVEASSRRGFLFLMKARRSRNVAWYPEAGAMFRKSIELSPGGIFGWISEWFSPLSDTALAILIEAMNGEDKSVFDAAKCLKPTLITDEVIEALSKHIPDLKKVKLRKCEGITDASLIALSKSSVDINELDISGCVEITDTGLGHLLSSCASLQRLDISRCPKLTNFSFSTAFSKLPKLLWFNCENCGFDGHHLSALEWLQSPPLQYLNLSNVQLLPEIWIKAFNMVKFDNLCELHLSDAVNLTDACIQAMVKSSGGNLERIVLNSAPRITNDAVVAIANYCPKLKHIDLSSCASITGKALDILATLNSNMESISLDSCVKIFDPDRSGFDKFVQCNFKLKKLTMSKTPLDDELISAFSNTKYLEELNLSETQVTAVGFSLIARQNSNLSVVNLSQLTNITDESILLLAKTVGENLTKLYVNGCRKVNAAIGNLGHYCNGLQILDASFTALDSDSLDKLTRGSPHIKELSLIDCREITDAAVHSIARLHSLERLDLSKCILLSNIELIATGCPSLEYLSLEKCEHIEASSIVSLSFLPLLRELNVVGVHGADDNMLVSFKDMTLWRSLEMLHIGNGNKFSNEKLEQYLPSRPSISVNMLMKSGQIPSPLQSNKKLHLVLNKSTLSAPNITQSGGSPSQSSARNDQAATRRLLQDLKQLQKFPVPSISACPVDDSNMFVWHCNLRAPEGSSYQGAIFHIELKFPSDYPTSPPRATMFTPCPHPHVKDGRICLDILSDFSSYFSDSQEGWTSAYSVQTILLQIQTFLMDLTPSDKDTTPIGHYLSKIPAAIAAASKFKCAQCSHGPDNIWPELLEKSSKSAEPAPSRSELDIIKDELKCFHTQSTFTEDILGIGISIERYKAGDIKELSSPFELLSKTAFFEQQVRSSVYATDENGGKITFDEWLPLYICKEHFDRGMADIGKSLMRICNARTFTSDLALQVFPKMMNKMVVSLMKGKLHGSVKALEGYIAFHRLFILYVEKYPDLLQKVNAVVGDFIQNESSRSKKAVPDLGEFMALLSVSSYCWEDISNAYLSETFTRNVRWVMQKYPELNSYTPNNELDRNRLSKTFLATTTSMQLMLYNVYFLEHIGRPRGKSLKEVAEIYDSLYGHASNSMKEKFLQCIQDVRNIKDYRDIFKRIGVPIPNDSELVTWMRSSVKRSVELGYHSLDSDGIRSSSNSTMNSPQRSNDRRNHLSSSSSGSPTRNFDNKRDQKSKDVVDEATKPVCRDWANTGTCPRDTKCRFAHPLSMKKR